jgi:hypothetical protein
MRKIIILILLLTILPGCSNEARMENLEYHTVSARLDSFNPEYQSGTLIDENGDMWAFCNVENLTDGNYTITYGKDFELISLECDGKFIDFD